ncbi:MAG: hypothetical protein K2V38_21790 [Gemmataceae bacterium]|nr:hypothetical protein [Gemmataceae bacterium]
MYTWKDTSAGADWAQSDPKVAERYGGNWVVAVQTIVEGETRREVIAHGPDAGEVRDAAARRLQLPPDEVVVCAVATMRSRVWFGG